MQNLVEKFIEVSISEEKITKLKRGQKKIPRMKYVEIKVCKTLTATHINIRGVRVESLQKHLQSLETYYQGSSTCLRLFCIMHGRN